MLNLLKSGENRVIVHLSDYIEAPSPITFTLNHIQTNKLYTFTDLTVTEGLRFDEFYFTSTDLEEGDYTYIISVNNLKVQKGLANVKLTEQSIINYNKETNERKSYNG